MCIQYASDLHLEFSDNRVWLKQNPIAATDAEVDYWIYGHSHRNMPPFSIGATQMLTNQLGYTWLQEHLSFDPEAAFEI